MSKTLKNKGSKMTLQEFKSWLEGFMAAKAGLQLTEADTKLINEKMSLVEETTHKEVEKIVEHHYYYYPNYITYPPIYYTIPETTSTPTWSPSWYTITSSSPAYIGNNISESSTPTVTWYYDPESNKYSDSSGNVIDFNTATSRGVTYS